MGSGEHVVWRRWKLQSWKWKLKIESLRRRVMDSMVMEMEFGMDTGNIPFFFLAIYTSKKYPFWFLILFRAMDVIHGPFHVGSIFLVSFGWAHEKPHNFCFIFSSS